MSGGYFEYRQYHLREILEDLISLVDNFKSIYLNDYVVDQTSLIKVIDVAIRKGLEFEIMVNRLDWLLSGDDGEESFYSKLSDELGKLGGYDAES